MMSPTTDNLAMLVIFLMLLCFLPLSNATNSTTNDISLKVLMDTILSKLEDMDGRIRQMDITITTLKEIQIANRESNSELKNDLESLKTELIGVIIQSNATLGEIKVVQDGMNVCNTIAQNISLASDLISGQLEKVQETFKGDLIRFDELPKKNDCASPWVNLEGPGCLLFSDEKVKWDSARFRCKAQGSGSDLAIITSSTQRQAVANHIKAAGYSHRDDWWIGGNARSGQWEWIHEQPITEPITEGWGASQPDHNSGDYCLYLDDPVDKFGTLWDTPCTRTSIEGFICQK